MKSSYSNKSVKELDKDIDRLAIQAQIVQDMEGNLLQQTGLKSNDRILEMGCGPGFISNILAKVAPDSEILSLDYSFDLLQQFYKNVSIIPAGGTKAVCASGNALPLKDQSRDFVYARFLMQHVPEPVTFITEGRRVLTDNGIFCIVDSDDSLIIHYPENDKINNFLKHVQSIQTEQGGDRFVGKKLSNLMVQAGFKDVKTQIIMFTTSQIPFEVLFNIIFGYKAKLVQKDQEMRAIFLELKGLIAKDEFILATGVFLVTAKK